jgi:ribosomal protein S18 acetylase RimI-like enzyme
MIAVRLEPAGIADAAAIAALRTAVAARLTAAFGKGHWSFAATEKGVLSGIKRSRVYVAKNGSRVMATLTLATRKPWAIDRRYFTDVKRPLYLVDMAVDPEVQGQGLGRRCVDEARTLAKEWPADAIFLDAYDTDAGAGGFYRKCGFREVGRATYRGTPLIYFECLLA